MDEDLKQLIYSCNGFDWDEGNRDKNKEKHGVTTEECEQVFFNQPLFVSVDYKHSEEEPRFFVLGHTDLGRRLFIVFTVRNNKIRVISARDMSKKERKIYEELSNEENTKVQE